MKTTYSFELKPLTVKNKEEQPPHRDYVTKDNFISHPKRNQNTEVLFEGIVITGTVESTPEETIEKAKMVGTVVDAIIQGIAKAIKEFGVQPEVNVETEPEPMGDENLQPMAGHS